MFTKTRIFIAILAFALIGISLTSATTAEAAGRGGCVTKKEFRKLDNGDSIGLVRAIVGQRGRTTSTNYFSDGDAWKTVAFKQCGKSWKRSAITLSFEKSSHEEYVSDWECFSDGECIDFGYYETVYTNPMVLTSKSAFWF